MWNLHHTAKVNVRQKPGDRRDENDQKAATCEEDAPSYPKVPAALQRFAASRTSGFRSVSLIVAAETRFMFDLWQRGIHTEKIIQSWANYNCGEAEKGQSEIRSPFENAKNTGYLTPRLNLPFRRSLPPKHRLYRSSVARQIVRPPSPSEPRPPRH